MRVLVAAPAAPRARAGHAHRCARARRRLRGPTMRVPLLVAVGCFSRICSASELPAQCPLFAAAAGTNPALLSKETQLVCPSIQAVRKWKALKFGLFMHWGPFSQPVPFDGVYPGASWRLNYQTAYMFWKRADGSSVCPPQNWTHITCPTKDQMLECAASIRTHAVTQSRTHARTHGRTDAVTHA